MKEMYVLATTSAVPIELGDLRDAFLASDVEFGSLDEGRLFSVKASETQLQVRFEARESGLGWTPELISGSDLAKSMLARARGFYRISFEPGKPQPSVAVFEALWCARAILDQVEGVLLDVSSFKLHEKNDVDEMTELEFDIRDHLTLHAVEATHTETPIWVHSHGMEKFGSRNLEIFHLSERDLTAAELFLHELGTEIVFGHPPPLRTAVETSTGTTFELIPSEEARLGLFGVDSDVFDGHEGKFLTIVSRGGRHNMVEILKPYREEFQLESAEQSVALRREALELLPVFKGRFQRRGLMEPTKFLVRTTFESHPKKETVTEDLWVEILAWDDTRLIGKIVDGGVHTTEWRRGTQVELEEADINALSVSRGGVPLDEEELHHFLFADRPS